MKKEEKCLEDTGEKDTLGCYLPKDHNDAYHEARLTHPINTPMGRDFIIQWPVNAKKS